MPTRLVKTKTAASRPRMIAAVPLIWPSMYSTPTAMAMTTFSAYTLSMMRALAIPPPSHIVCSP